MKYFKSDLKLNDFDIIKFNFEYIEVNIPKSLKVDPVEVFDGLDIDINFGITNLVDNENFQVFTKILINENKDKFGYHIFAEGVGHFSINKEVTDSIKRNLIQSALAININKLRETIFYSTLEYPLGSFQLPIVDLGKLIKEKKLEATEKDKPIKKKSKKLETGKKTNPSRKK